MDLQRSSVLVVICMLIFLDVANCTVTVTAPSGGNAVNIRGTLTLVCTISPLNTAMFWNTPGTSGNTACFCSNTADDCTLASPSLQDRYNCSSDISRREFTLTLTDVNLGDEGSYKCRHDADDNILIVTVEVPITGVNVTSPTTSPVTVTENVASTFVCETSPSRPQATIQWYKKSGDGSNTVAIPGGVISSQGSGESIFTRSTLQYIANRSDHDYRVYCAAYNIDPSSQFKSTRQPRLYVQYAPTNPTITGHAGGANFKIISGRSQTLTCTVQGGRPLATLSFSCFSGTKQDRSSGETVSKEVTWTAAHSHDGHRCTCQASQLFWPSPREVHVIVEALTAPSNPTFTVQSQSVSGTVSVIEDKDVSVLCSSYGNPPPGYTWTPQGSSTSSDTLTITNVQTSHQGNYTCEATNRMVPSQGDAENGANSAAVSLNVLFPPRSPSLTYGSINGPALPITFSVVRGDSFNIYCQAEAKPSPSSYQWTRQSGSNTRLTVTSIQTDGSWTCTVTNQMNPTVGVIEPGSNTAVTSASVMYGPSIPTLRYNYSISGSTPLTTGVLSVIQGKSFSVECDGSDSMPAPSYSWSGDITSPSVTLTVDNIQIARHEASATCTARNTMNRTFGAVRTGTSTKDLTIRVLYAPTVHSLSDQTAVENDRDFAKTCSYTPGNPGATVFEWTKSGSSTVISRYQTLTISEVSKASTGGYTCTAKNTMRPTGESAETGTHSQTFQLVVYYSASITAFSINSKSGSGPSTFDENSTVTVRCEVDSNPGSEIILTRDGIVLQTAENTREATHEFTKITCLDAGTYSCAAKNDYNINNIPDASSRQVFVRCPPRPFNTEYNQTYHHAIGDNVTLSIEFTAYPAPTSYKWYKQRHDVDWTEIIVGKSSAAHQANLTIENIKQDDFGQYRVDIVNSQSKLEHQFFVAAQDKPQVPTNGTVLDITQTSAVLQWVKGFNGGLQQTFYIEYLPSMNVEQIRDTYEDTVLNITLLNLSPGTKYQVRMFAGNAIGNSSKSTEYIFETKTLAVAPSDALPIGAIAGGAGGAVAAIVVVVVAIVVVRRIHARPKDGENATPTRTEPESNLPSDHQYYNVAFHSGSNEQGGEDGTSGQPYESLQTTRQGSELYDQLQRTQANTTDVDNRSTYEQLDPRLRRNDGVYADINAAAGTPAHEDGRVYVNLKLTS